MDEHPQYILHFMSLCYIMLLTLFAFNATSTHMASVKGAFLFIRIITIYLFNLSSFFFFFTTLFLIHPSICSLLLIIIWVVGKLETILL